MLKKLSSLICDWLMGLAATPADENVNLPQTTAGNNQKVKASIPCLARETHHNLYHLNARRTKPSQELLKLIPSLELVYAIVKVSIVKEACSIS